MSHRSRTALAVLFLPVALAGCSSATYPVAGVVTMDGAPAPLVVVRFHPVNPDAIGGGTAHTDEAGKFAIGELVKNTGLASGPYKVTFSQTLIDGKPTLAGSGGKASERAPTEKEAVADEFRDPQKTPITATVGGKSDNLTFDIKSRK